jgi:hypothetical protein
MSNLISVRLQTVLVHRFEKWCMVCTKCTIGSEIVLEAPKGQVTRLKWKLVLVYLGTVLFLTQCWCMVCAEHTIVLENILDAPDGTPR